jgi:hypothetical protein
VTVGAGPGFLKHFALNNVEKNRTGISSQISATDLYGCEPRLVTGCPANV